MSTKTYDQLLSALNGRQTRKVQNNTRATLGEDESITLRLHQTDIIKVQKDGTITVTSGGWKSSTTKARLNEWLPVSIYQNKGQWFWSSGIPFTDGDRIDSEGKVLAQGSLDSVKQDAKLRRQVLKYARLCAEAVPLAHPGGGDCWYCHLHTQEGQSLGDATSNHDHIREHIKETYIVPSLVYTALKEAGTTDLVISAAFNPAGYLSEIAKRLVKSAVASFIFRRFGMVAKGGWGQRQGFAVR